MKKVYILTSGEYSDYSIDGVFSTRYRATKYREKWGGEIETWNLDEPIPSAGWVIQMKRDGTLFASWVFAVRAGAKEGFICFTAGIGEPSISWHVNTEDKERAIKIVNEKRIQILALGIWGDAKKVKQMIS